MLYQQPILDLRTGAIARHELLLRMVGADGEHVPPATFLYVAERFGLIQEIDAWVVRQAVALIAEHSSGSDGGCGSRSTSSGLVADRAPR